MKPKKPTKEKKNILKKIAKYKKRAHPPLMDAVCTNNI